MSDRQLRDEAVTLFAKMEAAPSLARVLRDRANVLRALGRTADALVLSIALLEKAVTLATDVPDYRAWLAKARTAR